MTLLPDVCGKQLNGLLVTWIEFTEMVLLDVTRLYRPKVQKARSITWTRDIMTDLSSSLEEARRLLFIISITRRTIDRQSNDWRVEGYAFRNVCGNMKRW
jgi:hypothetical protein